MSDTAIHINNIGKMYQLRHKSKGAESLVGSIGSGLKAMFRSNETQSTEEFWALKNISFDIKKGDRVGIIGRNGAGKSTLLKILSRVVKPSTGQIEFQGRMAALLEVGTGFHGDLSGRENIYLNGSILGMNKTEIDRKFDEIVAFSEVEQFLDTPVKRYSSGMYVRLAFAIAAHLEPEILIVDEVLAVGDSAFQKKCLGKMEEVSQKEGRTILFVSHQMNTVQALCNKALVLHQGQIDLPLSSTEEAIKHYMNLASRVSKGSLVERRDRSGEGKIKVSNILYSSSEGKPMEELICGQAVSIRVEYTCQQQFEGNNLSVALAFYGDDGVLYTVLSSEYTGVLFDKVSGTGAFECKIQKLPLMEGNYLVNVSLTQGGMLQDWVQEASSINVIAGDFYGSGKLNPSTHRSVLIENTWKKVK